MKRALLTVALVLACKGAKKEAPERPATNGEAVLSRQQIATMQIATAPVQVQPVGGTLDAPGRIAFDDLKVSHLFSPVTGRVTSIRAQLGQHVAKGAPLAGIQSPDLGSAIADVKKAEADLIAAEHELKRQRDLFEAHASARRDLETAEDNERKARAEVHRAREKARLLHGGGVDEVTQEYLLRSPIAGEVIARNVNPGTELQGQYTGGTQLEIFTIGSLDEVWAIADIFEVDLPKIQLGALVSVSVVAYPERKFTGRVDWIAGALDPATRTARVRCTLENRDRALKPEMYATLSIEVPKTNALAIPRSAILRLNDQTVVFVQTGTTESGLLRFARRVVRVDESVTGDVVPVVDGLKAGETVVSAGGLILSGSI